MAHIFAFGNKIRGRCRPYLCLVKLDIQQLPLTYDIGILLKKERYARERYGQRKTGVYDIAAAGVHIPFAKQSRRYVYGYGICLALVDIPHQRHEATLERFAQPCPEKTVEHHVALAQIWRSEIACHLGKINLVHTDKAVALLFAVMRQLVVHIKQKHLHPLVTLLYKHSGHCQRIAAVIARTGYDHYALRGQKARNNLATHRTGGTFHKLYGIYFLRLTRSAVYILDYIRVKYFHQKQVLKGCLT